MAANKKPRKKYRPKAIHPNPVELALNNVSLADEDSKLVVKAINHGALSALVHGTGTKQDWKYLNGAVNIGLVLAEASTFGGYGYEYWGELEAAQKALASIGRRWMQWGKWQTTPAEQELLDRALEIHHAQLEAVTIGDVQRAELEVSRRLLDPNRRHTVKDLAASFKPAEAQKAA